MLFLSPAVSTKIENIAAEYAGIHLISKQQSMI